MQLSTELIRRASEGGVVLSTGLERVERQGGDEEQRDTILSPCTDFTSEYKGSIPLEKRAPPNVRPLFLRHQVYQINCQ